MNSLCELTPVLTYCIVEICVGALAVGNDMGFGFEHGCESNLPFLVGSCCRS